MAAEIRKVDSQGRISLPAKWRAKIKPLATIGSLLSLFEKLTKLIEPLFK